MTKRNPAADVGKDVRDFALLLLVLLGSACDLEASQRAFQPGARAARDTPPKPLRARAGWSAILSATGDSSAEVLEGDDLDLPMGAEEGMVIPSACGACGCLNLDR